MLPGAEEPPRKEKKAKKRKMIRLARRFPVPRHGVGMGSGCGTDQSVVARTARGWCEVALNQSLSRAKTPRLPTYPSRALREPR